MRVGPTNEIDTRVRLESRAFRTNLLSSVADVGRFFLNFYRACSPQYRHADLDNRIRLFHRHVLFYAVNTIYLHRFVIDNVRGSTVFRI